MPNSLNHLFFVLRHVLDNRLGRTGRVNCEPRWTQSSLRCIRPFQLRFYAETGDALHQVCDQWWFSEEAFDLLI